MKYTFTTKPGNYLTFPEIRQPQIVPTGGTRRAGTGTGSGDKPLPMFAQHNYNRYLAQMTLDSLESKISNGENLSEEELMQYNGATMILSQVPAQSLLYEETVKSLSDKIQYVYAPNGDYFLKPDNTFTTIGQAIEEATKNQNVNPSTFLGSLIGVSNAKSIEEFINTKTPTIKSTGIKQLYVDSNGVITNSPLDVSGTAITTTTDESNIEQLKALKSLFDFNNLSREYKMGILNDYANRGSNYSSIKIIGKDVYGKLSNDMKKNFIPSADGQNYYSRGQFTDVEIGIDEKESNSGMYYRAASDGRETGRYIIKARNEKEAKELVAKYKKDGLLTTVKNADGDEMFIAPYSVNEYTEDKVSLLAGVLYTKKIDVNYSINKGKENKENTEEIKTGWSNIRFDDKGWVSGLTGIGKGAPSLGFGDYLKNILSLGLTKNPYILSPDSKAIKSLNSIANNFSEKTGFGSNVEKYVYEIGNDDNTVYNMYNHLKLLQFNNEGVEFTANNVPHFIVKLHSKLTDVPATAFNINDRTGYTYNVTTADIVVHKDYLEKMSGYNIKSGNETIQLIDTNGKFTDYGEMYFSPRKLNDVEDELLLDDTVKTEFNNFANRDHSDYYVITVPLNESYYINAATLMKSTKGNVNAPTNVNVEYK